MRVLLVTPYRDFSGGVESVNRMLQTILEEDGHIVDYLTADDRYSAPRSPLLGRAVGLPAVTAARYKQIKRAQYDVVIANGEFGWRIDHPNAVCLFHGSYLGLRNYLRPYLSVRQYLMLTRNAWIQRRAAAGKYVVTVSRFIADILKMQGIAVSKVIENSVDTERFCPEGLGGADRYLFVGSYQRYGKGFDVLEELARRGHPIDCMTNADPGKYLSHLKPVPQEKMHEVYRRYRLLVFPSRFEANALVPLEAMSSGLPVVMTNVGIGPELGKVIPEFVVDLASNDLPSAIEKRIAEIEGRYAEYAAAARNYVLQSHSFSRFRDEWLTTIRRLGRC